MTKIPYLMLFAGVLTAGGPALAQDARQRVPPPDSSSGSSAPTSGQTTSSGSGQTSGQTTSAGSSSGSSSGQSGESGAQPRQAVPRGEVRGNPRIERAERGESAPPPAPARVPPPAVSRVPPPAPAAAPPPPTRAVMPPPALPEEAAAQAVPRGSRPRGDNPPTGRAVERPPDRRGGGDGRGDTRVYTAPPRVYNNYYYYPRRSYPYGYGAFGLGYFYYDPYTWYPGGYSYDPYYPGRPYGYYDRGYRYDIGSLRIDVRPRDAEVYVDGYFAGRVDDFDGAFQSLDLEEGPYRIEIVMPGFETLEINIRIQPARKITYRGNLKRLP